MTDKIRELAQQQYEAYDFGDCEVEGHTGWEYEEIMQGRHHDFYEIRRKVFIRFRDEEESRTVSFYVRINKTMAITEVSALLMENGSEIGHRA